MSEPDTTTPTPTRTHVNGKQIIAIEPATGPHPRWPERTATFKGVSKALLEDGTEVWLCEGDDGTCTFVGGRTKSVVTHANATHRRTTPRDRSLYSDDVLRRVALEVRRAQADGAKAYAEVAAAALNKAAIPTKHGGPWSGQNVSHLYRRWGKTIRVRVPKPTTPTQRAAARVRQAVGIQEEVAVSNGHVEGLEPDDLKSLEVFVRIVGPGPLGDALRRLMNAASNQPTAEVVEKARKYDELQVLLGRG